MALPGPAPWPAVNPKTTAASAATLSDGQVSTAATRSAGGGVSSLPSQQRILASQLQQDIEKELLLQSIVNSLNTQRVADGSSLGQSLLADQARTLGRVPAPSRPTELPSVLQGFDAAHGVNRGLLSGFSSFHTASQSPSTGSSVYRQQQQASSSSGAGGESPLVRLYLQQQQNQRQENLLLRQELIRQELLRRDLEQRDTQRRR